MRERTKTRAEQQRLGLIGRVKQFHLTMVLFSSAKTGVQIVFLFVKRIPKIRLFQYWTPKIHKTSVWEHCVFFKSNTNWQDD